MFYIQLLYLFMLEFILIDWGVGGSDVITERINKVDINLLKYANI